MVHPSYGSFAVGNVGQTRTNETDPTSVSDLMQKRTDSTKNQDEERKNRSGVVKANDISW